MKKLTKLAPGILMLIPFLALAQGFDTTHQLIRGVGSIVQTLTYVAAGVALLVFFWGLAKFILKVGGSEDAVEEGKRLMIWGILALFVMVSVWGIIYFIGDEILVGTTNFNAPQVPTFRPAP